MITGASGFSGSALVECLLESDIQVIAHLSRGSPRIATLQSSNHNLEIAYGSLIEPLKLTGEIDAIIHVAARSAWPGVTTEDLVRDNVIATRMLISQAKFFHVKKLIFFSSLSIHGEVLSPVVDSFTPVINPDAYGITKRLCELMLAAEKNSFKSLVFRLPGILGPGSVRNWLSTSLMASKKGEDIVVFDPSAAFNNAVHINDLGEFIINLLDQNWSKDYDAFPLGSKDIILAGEVAEMLAQAGGNLSEIKVSKNPRKSYCISSDHAMNQYGYRPMSTCKMIETFIKENIAYE